MVSRGINIGWSKNITILHNHISDCWYGVFVERSKSIFIIQNNIVNHFRSTKSWDSIVLWDGNYWGRPRLLPYPILGLFLIIPFISFDWHPAQEPYVIGV